MPTPLVVKNGSAALRSVSLVHPFTRVDHADADILTSLQSRTVSIRDTFFPRGQDDVAPIGHGVAGVQAEVEESQLQLIGVHLDWLESERETGLDVIRRPH